MSADSLVTVLRTGSRRRFVPVAASYRSYGITESAIVLRGVGSGERGDEVRFLRKSPDGRYAGDVCRFLSVEREAYRSLVLEVAEKPSHLCLYGNVTKVPRVQRRFRLPGDHLSRKYLGTPGQALYFIP